MSIHQWKMALKLLRNKLLEHWKCLLMTCYVVGVYLFKRHIDYLYGDEMKSDMDYLTSKYKRDYFKYNELVREDSKSFYFHETPYTSLEFEFRYRPDMKSCDTQGIKVVYLVDSKPRDFANRMRIRRTWGKASCPKELPNSSKLIFILGNVQVGDGNGHWTTAQQKQLEKEIQLNADILSVNDLEEDDSSQHIKIIAGLNLTHAECSKAKYVLFTNSDTRVNPAALYRKLDGVSALMYDHFAAGSVVYNSLADNLLPDGSYRLLYNYPLKFYPDYPTDLVVMSYPVMELVQTAMHNTAAIPFHAGPMLGVVLHLLGIQIQNWREICTPSYCVRELATDEYVATTVDRSACRFTLFQSKRLGNNSVFC